MRGMQKRIKIESEIKNLRIVEKEIDEISSALSITEQSYGKIMVAAMEAVNNAIIHGNKSDTHKFVIVDIYDKKRSLIIIVEDEGLGFRPKEIPYPTSPGNIENISGRGVFLMSHLADKIEFNERGNRVKMIFKDIRS